MVFLKIYSHIIANIKKVLYKSIYGNKIKFGKNFTFRKGFTLVFDKSARLQIGDNCFFNNGCSINCLNSIRIGNGTIFGEGVKIYDHNHCFSDLKKLIREQGFSTGTVSIGNHCWIGSNVVILKGAKIGDSCVIGAGVVISEFIPNGTIVKQKMHYEFEKIRENNREV